jgi:hypothetical protein
MSAVTLAPRHGKTIHAQFVPFGGMTARQQAEHLVYAHGMNGDYFGDEEAAGKSNEVVVAYLLAWSGDRRWGTHEDDHFYLEKEPDVLSCQHTHDKAVPA